MRSIIGGMIVRLMGWTGICLLVLAGQASAQPEPELTLKGAIGPKNCILGTDLGVSPRPFKRPMPPQGLLDFMTALHKQGISVADINVMAKTNPALALGLKP
jgi:hypothetical protein